MKVNTIKKLWKLFKIFAVAGFLFWATETIIFLFVYGWHWTAFTTDEKYCDIISKVLFTIGWTFFLAAVYNVIDYLLKTEITE